MPDGLILPPRLVLPGDRRWLDPADSINADLQAFWPLDETQRQTAYDIGPYRWNLSSATWPTRIVGEKGRATNFAGASGQYLQNSTFRWPGGKHAAISVWINVPGSYNGSPWDFGGGRTLPSGNAFYGHLPYGNNNAYFYYGNVSNGEISTSLASYLNQWIHIAWSSSPNRKAIWINGRLATASGTVPASAVAAGTGAYVGYSPVSAMFHLGAMRLFRLRAREWTDAEVVRLYREPWAGTWAPADRIWMAVRAPASVTSVSLTGISATASAGTVGAGIAGSVSGSAGTSAAGTLASAIASTVSGAAATMAAGTTTAAIGMALTGAALTTSAGSLAYTIGFTLTGAASTAAGGTLATSGGDTSAERSLTGISMTALPGNVRVTGGTRWRPQAAQAVVPPSMVGNTLPPPPRLTGTPALDTLAQQQWLATVYDQLVKRMNVIGRVSDHEERIARLENFYN